MRWRAPLQMSIMEKEGKAKKVLNELSSKITIEPVDVCVCVYISYPHTHTHTQTILVHSTTFTQNMSENGKSKIANKRTSLFQPLKNSFL